MLKRALIFVALASAAGCSSADSARETPSEGGAADTSTGADAGMDVTVYSKDGGADEGRAADSGEKDGPQEAPSDDVDDFGKRKDSAATDAGCTIPDPDAGPGGELTWAKSFGKTGYMSTEAVAIDPSSGDTVAVGYFEGSVNFGGGLHESAEGGADYSMYVAKFDATGAYVWAKTFPNALAYAVAVDSAGNVAVGGSFFNPIAFDGHPHTPVGDTDVFLVDFTSAGAYRWSKSFGSAGNDQEIDSIGIDPTNDVVIAGLGTDVSFGGSAVSGNYIAKFGTKGAYAWSHGYPGTSTESRPLLTMDPSGNVILAGSFSGTANLGGGALKTSGFSTFVAKYDSSGAYRWAKHYGNGAAPTGVAADACGAILVTGNFGETINFGTGKLTANPSVENLFVAKIDATGAGVWASGFEGSSVDGLSAGTLAVNSAGGPIVSASVSGTVNFGGGSLASAGEGSVAIAAFNADGVYRWATIGGPPSKAEGSGTGYQSVAVGGSQVVLMGNILGACPGTCTKSPPGTTLVLDGKTLTAGSTEALFLASFTP